MKHHEKLVSKGLLDVSEIQGGWERYMIKSLSLKGKETEEDLRRPRRNKEESPHQNVRQKLKGRITANLTKESDGEFAKTK